MTTDFRFKLTRTDSSTFGLEHEKERKYKNITKKTPTKILLGHRSYQEDLHEKEAYYDVPLDKEKLANSLHKTRMCSSLECQYGENCRFAHSLDELKISNCLFEQRCRFVRMSNGELINYGEKVCSHKHPHETKETFLSRTGLDRYKQSSKSVDQPQVEPQPMFLQPQVETQPMFWQPQFVQAQVEPQPMFLQPQFVQPMFWQPPPPPPPPPPFPKPFVVDQQCQTNKVDTLADEILVIRVPKELANQALEIAMKSEKVRIQIEII